MNIKLITTDGFQSVDTRQILATKGFKVGYTSLDRTPDGYDGLKSAITDTRIVLLQGCDKLWDELTDLERDNMTRKFDHPVHGSKDISDSLAGAHYDAMQYKDEFMFFHPDDYDYEGLNTSSSEEQKYRDEMIKDLTGGQIKSTQKISVEDILYSMDDSSILLL